MYEDRPLCKVIHPDPDKRRPIGFLKEPDPPSFIAVADHFTLLYASFIEMLRTGEIEAHCLPAARRYPVVIPKPIWWHRDFYFDANTGDVFQVNPQSGDWLVKVWIGAELRRGRATAAEHNSDEASPPVGCFAPLPTDDLRSAARDRNSGVHMPTALTPTEQAVHLAVVSLWPEKPPPGLKSKERDKQILDWQKKNKLSVASPSTIKRYFQKMKRGLLSGPATP
jgi:hypothetical protein